MRKRNVLLAIGAALIVLCGLGAFTQARAMSYSDLVARLRAANVAVVENGDLAQGQEPLLAGMGRAIMVNGERVETYEYATTFFATFDAAHISSDGSTFRSGFGPLGGSATAVDWVATPHFYRSGRLIVQYIGTHQDVTAALASTLGPQFAGGTP